MSEPVMPVLSTSLTRASSLTNPDAFSLKDTGKRLDMPAQSTKDPPTNVPDICRHR
jgi:hypothetical protein